MPLPNELVAFSVALVASFGLTIPARHFALRVGMVDHPGPRKMHHTPIPLLGGLAIYSAVLLASVFAWQGTTRAEILAVLAGATLLAIVGVLDDRGLLHHQLKLFVGMPVAALILVAAGIRVHVFSTWIPGAWGVVLDEGLTIFWVVGITAAFSILDHMDGLCAGVAAVAAACFTLLALLSGQVLVSTLAAGVLGAALGFLRWNFSTAKIFMGDGGAMFLGFMLATLGIKLRYPAPAFAVSWLVPVLVLGVSIFDTTLVSISRARRGLIPFTSPGKDHAAHRLSNLGLGYRGAVLAMYGLGAVFGLAAFVLTRVSLVPALAICGVVAVGVLVAVALLERAPYERQPKKQS